MGLTTTKELPIVQLKMGQINTKGGTQPRVTTVHEVVLEYAEVLDDLPEVDVFFDGMTYWLADGFHRYKAHEEKKRTTIYCRKHLGTVRDAILFAVGANAKNGLQLTREDKRHICRMLLSDEKWGKWSDREISRQGHISHWLVADVRREMEEEEAARKEKEQAAKAAEEERAKREAEEKAAADRAKTRADWKLPGKQTAPAPKTASSGGGGNGVTGSTSSDEPGQQEGRTYRTKHGGIAQIKTSGISKANKGRDRNLVRVERDKDKLKELDNQIKRSRKKYVRQCLKRGMTREEILADVEKEIAENPIAG